MTRTSDFSGISVCVFDAYGTLFDLGSFVDRFQADLGYHAEPMMALWRRKQLEYSWLRSLMGRHTDFWHVTGESLDRAMESFDIVDPSLRARLMEAWLVPKAFAEADSVLARLQEAGMRTAILSNGSPSMLVSGLNSTGLSERIDTVLSVEKVGVFKPHPSVYKLVTDQFEVGPKAVCFVSGNGWDVAGAAGFGFRVAWVNRGASAREHLPAGPDAELTDLSGLPALLGL
jgi:2-haloacid dehalogenase